MEPSKKEHPGVRKKSAGGHRQCSGGGGGVGGRGDELYSFERITNEEGGSDETGRGKKKELRFEKREYLRRVENK